MAGGAQGPAVRHLQSAVNIELAANGLIFRNAPLRAAARDECFRAGSNLRRFREYLAATFDEQSPCPSATDLKDIEAVLDVPGAPLLHINSTGRSCILAKDGSEGSECLSFPNEQRAFAVLSND